jgi:hypothetical protein
METDIPLRTLTHACAPDLLSLFGEGDAEVVEVVSLEMPTFAHRLDNFHCVRLWELNAADAVRTGRPGLAVLSPLMRDATVPLVEEASRVVLHVEQDAQRQADLLAVLGVFAEPLIAPTQFVRLFEKERLMESKLLDLLVQDKLELLEQERARERAALEQERARERAALEQQQAALQQQQAMLEQRQAVLEQRQAVLEEQRAVLEEQRLALEQERARGQAALEQERARERAALEQQRTAWALAETLKHAVETAISGRFPTAPLTLGENLRHVQDPERLTDLLLAVLRAPDLETVAQAVTAAAG